MNDICNGAGTPIGNNRYRSNQPFPVVTCKHTGGIQHPKCEYRGNRDTRRIEISCDLDQSQPGKRWPTHYGGDFVVV